MKPGGNDGPGDWDCPMKISVHFISVYPLKKPNFKPLSRCLPFEHSGTKKWTALTLNLCAHHCAQVLHLHISHQTFTSTCFSTAYAVPSCSAQITCGRYCIVFPLRWSLVTHAALARGLANNPTDTHISNETSDDLCWIIFPCSQNWGWLANVTSWCLRQVPTFFQYGTVCEHPASCWYLNQHGVLARG